MPSSDAAFPSGRPKLEIGQRGDSERTEVKDRYNSAVNSALQAIRETSFRLADAPQELVSWLLSEADSVVGEHVIRAQLAELQESGAFSALEATRALVFLGLELTEDNLRTDLGVVVADLVGEIASLISNQPPNAHSVIESFELDTLSQSELIGRIPEVLREIEDQRVVLELALETNTDGSIGTTTNSREET